MLESFELLFLTAHCLNVKLRANICLRYNKDERNYFKKKYNFKVVIRKKIFNIFQEIYKKMNNTSRALSLIVLSVLLASLSKNLYNCVIFSI